MNKNFNKQKVYTWLLKALVGWFFPFFSIPSFAEDSTLNHRAAEYFDNNAVFEGRGNLFVIRPAIVSAGLAIQVSGKVTDEKGDPLPGVNVLVKGTANGTSTDANGKYSLSVDAPKAVLVFSFIGYQTKEVSIGALSIIDVTLLTDVKTLDELVVIGYGSVKKSDLTGAVAEIKSNELVRINPVSLSQGLQGKVAGVQVVQNDGAPGAGMSMQIRGANSFLGGTEPLYVIDGIPFTGDNSTATPKSAIGNERQTQNTLSFLNPQDIESIEVLKDASATAIYGSRGANGVVLITTKKGKKGEDKIDLNLVYGVSTVFRTIKMLDAETFANFQNEAVTNANNYADTNTALPFSGKTDPVSGIYRPKPEEFAGTTTDWQKKVFKAAGYQNLTVTLSGGGERGTHALSFDHLNQQGILPNSKYIRESGRINLSRKIKTWLTISTNTSWSHSTNNTLVTSTSDLYGSGGVIRSILIYPPVLSAAQSGIVRISDPLTYLNDVKNSIVSDNVFSSNSLDFILYKNFTFRQDFGINYSANSRNQYYPVTTSEGKSAQGIANESYTNTTSMVMQSVLTYSRRFQEDHSLAVTGGMVYESSLYKYGSMSATNFPNDILSSYNLGSGATPGKPDNGRSPRKLLSFLGRINYSYKEKYLATASFRSDGSSNFGEDNRRANFPSVALAWKINNEDFAGSFIRDLPELKLRVGYGVTGNQAITPYSALTQYAPATYYYNGVLQTGYATQILGNNKLKWESTAQTNVGIDMVLPAKVVSVTIDWYSKITGNLLQNVIFPGSIGYYSQLQNIGSVQNKGLEIVVSTDLLNSKDFKWNLQGNFSRNRNKILSLGEKDTQFAEKITLNDAPFIQKVGYPIGQLYGYKENGFYNTLEEVRADPMYAGAAATTAKSMIGEIRYEHTGNSIGEKDLTFIGDTNPKFSFGFTNNFTFKNFDLNIFISGVQGNDVINLNNYYMGPIGAPIYGNIPQKFYDERWTPQNFENAKYPKPFATDLRQLKFTRRFIEDGSFVKIRNITLGYNPQISRLRSLRIYIAVNNPYYFTRYLGYDPEVNGYGQNPSLRGVDLGGYPSSRQFIIGARCSF